MNLLAAVDCQRQRAPVDSAFANLLKEVKYEA